MTRTLTDKSKDYVEYNAHWSYCVKNDIPFIRIIPTIKFSQIEFDISTMLHLFEIAATPTDFLMELYKGYAEFFMLPKNKISCAGGSKNLILTLHNEHADFFANQLFDYLLEFTKANRKSLETLNK